MYYNYLQLCVFHYSELSSNPLDPCWPWPWRWRRDWEQPLARHVRLRTCRGGGARVEKPIHKYKTILLTLCFIDQKVAPLSLLQYSMVWLCKKSGLVCWNVKLVKITRRYLYIILVPELWWWDGRFRRRGSLHLWPDGCSLRPLLPAQLPQRMRRRREFSGVLDNLEKQFGKTFSTPRHSTWPDPPDSDSPGFFDVKRKMEALAIYRFYFRWLLRGWHVWWVIKRKDDPISIAPNCVSNESAFWVSHEGPLRRNPRCRS